MNTATVDYLSQLLLEGATVQQDREIELWRSKVAAFLESAIGSAEATDFEVLQDDDLWKEHAFHIGHLQGLIAKWQDQRLLISSEDLIREQSSIRLPTTAPTSKRVFIVHGHDEQAKDSAARFLTKLGLEPIILHEQPSSGRTIIEKFESYSGDIAFAVVLLTPDDLGSQKDPLDLKPRARQNVIMELGYFIGRLGRARVCALHKGGVELPSDYQGVVYLDMDPPGAWRAQLAQEFVQAKIPIELSGLLGS